MRFRNFIKGNNHICRIFDTAGIVWRDQHNSPGARGDPDHSIFWVGDHIAVAGQGHRSNPSHIQPHFMVEIERGGQQDLIALAAEHCNTSAKRLIAA